MSRKVWITAAIMLMPGLSLAQSGLDSATYRRAQLLVNDGSAATGRAIVDSMIARATPGTNSYAEGLYWRAVLSATAADAEMDYRRIIVDYPLSPRVEDVLLRLAQLEMAQADYDGALQHLNRLTLEHPTGDARARAGYWMARVLYEKSDIPKACAANADALSRTSQDDAELRNQISYLNQRCVGVALAPATPTIQPADSPADSPAVTKPDTVAKVVAVAPALAPVMQKPAMKPPAAPRDGKPSMVDPSQGLPARTTSVKAAPVETSSEGEGYSVQIAAYNVKSQAVAMVAKLKNKGYEARVSGTSAPFRVRIGHYASQAQATAVMRSLKTKQINGFVVKAESQ